MESKIPKTKEKEGKTHMPSKKPNFLYLRANGQRIVLKRNSFSDADPISYYNEMPESEIDEIICTGKDDSENDIFLIKHRDQSFKSKKAINRDEFKNYLNGEQIFNYFSKHIDVRKLPINDDTQMLVKNYVESHYTSNA